MTDTGYGSQQPLATASIWGGAGLRHLDIELTERCNSACIHCCINRPLGDGQAQARELSTAAWQEIIRQAAELGALTLRMTGGEILVREDFTELYLFARRQGLKVMLYTNGRGITPELVALWARVPPLEPIELTVYGMQPASYEATTASPGAHAEFARGLALLQEYGIPYVVKAPVLPTTRAELDDFEAWAASIPWMREAPAFSYYLDLRGRRDSEAKNRRLQALRLSPAEIVAFLHRRGEEYRRAMVQFVARMLIPPGEELFNCGAGKSVCVDAYGQLQPCLLLRHPELTYDLRQGTLRDGLADLRERVAAAQATNPEYRMRCARCFLKGLCEQCPAKAWIEHGTLDTPVEYYCEIAHARARDLGLLAEGEQAWEVTDSEQRLHAFIEEYDYDHDTGSPVTNAVSPV